MPESPAACSGPGAGQTGAIRMRFFWVAVAAVTIWLFVDHIYADGRGADELFSIVRELVLSIRHWSDDLLQPLRR
jgi:hypothetical protein